MRNEHMMGKSPLDNDNLDCCFFIHDETVIQCGKKEQCCIYMESTLVRCPHGQQRKEFR